MSAQKPFKNHSSFQRFDGFYRTQLLQKSTHSRSKPRPQMAASMTKSFYSQFNTDRKSQGVNKTETLMSLKSETISQLALKKHQNKKLNKLISLIAYTITSADKAIRFLDISCNYQAEFASKLYLSDRETLLKELNAFNLNSLHDNPSIVHAIDAKSLLLDQSIMQQSKQLRQQNERLKRQLASIDIQINKQQKYAIFQSKSSHNFLATQQVSEYSALLLTKSCEFDLLREEYDFIQLEYKKMANLLKQICNFDEITDYLTNLKEESKWKIQALNTEHTVKQKLKFQHLAQESERRTRDLFIKIVNKMEKNRYAEKENILIEQQLRNKTKEIESISLQFIRKCEAQAQRQVQYHIKQARYSEEVLKLRQYITHLQQKIANIQVLVIAMNGSEHPNASTVQDYINIIGKKLKAYDQLLQLKCHLEEKNIVFVEDINRLQYEVLQLNSRLNEANQKIQQNSQSTEVLSENHLQELKDMKELLQRKQQEITTLDILSSKYKQVNKELQQKCIIYEKQGAIQGQQISLTQDSCLRLKELLLKHQRTIDELNQKNDEISNKFAILKLHQLQNSQKFIIMKKQLEHSRQENQYLKALHSSKQNEIINTKNDFEVSKSNHQTKLRQYEQNLTCLHSIRDDLQHLLSDSRQKSNQTLKTYQNLIAHLKQDNETVRKQNGDIKKLLFQIQEQVRGKNGSKLQINEQMSNMVREIDDFKGQIGQNNNSFRQRQQHLNKIIFEKEAMIEQIKKEVIDFQQINEHLERDIIEYKENINKMTTQLQENSQIFNDNYLKLKSQAQKEKNQKQKLQIQLQKLRQILTKEVSERLQFTKIGQEAVKCSTNTINEKDIEISLLREQCNELSVKLIETSNEKESIEKKLHQQRELQVIQGKAARHQHLNELTCLKKQLGIYQQRCKTMQIEKIIAQKYASESIQKYQAEIAAHKQELMLRTSMHHKEWQQLSSNLSWKEQELKNMQERFNALIDKFTIQRQRLRYFQQRRKNAQTQEKQEKSFIKQEGQQRQKHIEGSMQNGSNNFTDFGSYIQRKMGEDSFVSIIHSSASNSDHSKVFEGLTPLQSRKKDEADDQFQDFSSSQAEEAMYSISSHNESVEQATMMLVVPQQWSNKLLTSTQNGSVVPLFEQSKLTSSREKQPQKVEHRLRRTFSIIRDEDPVLERDQLSPSSSLKKNSNNNIKDAFSNK